MVDKLKEGYTANGKKFKVHPDGYNLLPYLTGKEEKSPRKEIFYFSQGGELNAVRVENWKIHFATISGNIATGVRETPGWPLIINLRADPYEEMWHESSMYIRWYADNMWLFVPIQGQLQNFFATIPDYPFQEGSSLSAAGINYNSLKAMKAMNMLKELKEQFPVNR